MDALLPGSTDWEMDCCFGPLDVQDLLGAVGRHGFPRSCNTVASDLNRLSVQLHENGDTSGSTSCPLQTGPQVTALGCADIQLAAGMPDMAFCHTCRNAWLEAAGHQADQQCMASPSAVSSFKARCRPGTPSTYLINGAHDVVQQQQYLARGVEANQRQPLHMELQVQVLNDYVADSSGSTLLHMLARMVKRQGQQFDMVADLHEQIHTLTDSMKLLAGRLVQTSTVELQCFQ